MTTGEMRTQRGCGVAFTSKSSVPSPLMSMPQWAAATPCTAANWSNVTAAKIYVLSRNLEPSQGYTDDKAYSMGLSGATSAANDSFKRHVYSAQVAMPNRSGPREPAFKS